MKRAVALSLALVLAFATEALARNVLFQGAVDGAHARPASLWLSADGTLEASHMRWRSWGGPVAVGDGKIEWHGCMPSCAAAPDHEARGSAHLSQIRICKGRAYYSKVSVYVAHGGRERLLRAVKINYAPC